MTDLCPTTGKPQLTAAAARRQVKHSRRTFTAGRCRSCGRWHVNTLDPFRHFKRQQKARRRELRRNPIDIEDDTP